MNGNKTGATIAWIVVVILVGLGVYYWAKYKPPTSTTLYNTNQTNPEAASVTPTVSTKPAGYISQSTAVLNGDVNPGRAQTSYWYEYGPTNSLGSFTAAQLVGSGDAMYSAPKSVSGLKPSTTYYYRVIAENQNGKVFGDILSFTTSANIPPITYKSPTVQTRNASSISTNSATLNGVVSSNGPAAIYWFEFGKDFGLGTGISVAAASIEGADIAVTSTITGLEPNTMYYYRLNAQNAYGTVNGNVSVFTTQKK